LLNNSLLLKPIFFVINIINTSYENSILKRLIDFIFGIFRKLNTLYENSFTSYLASSVTGLFQNSAIIGFFIGKGRFSRWWEESLFYRIINGIVEIPSKLLKGFYQKHEEFFLGSIIIRLVRELLSRLEIMVGLFLIILLVVPNARWNNVYNVGIALFLCVLIFINTVIQRHWVFNFKALDFTLILFMVAVTLSFVTSLSFSASLKYWLFYLAGFLTVLGIVSTVKNEGSLQTIVEMFLWGIAVIGAYGVWQAATGTVSFDPSLTDPDLNFNMPGRVYATMANPNNYGEILIMALPFYLSVVINSKTFLKKAVYTGLALFPLIALFYTGSRSSWVGFAVSAIVITFLLNKRLLPFVFLGGVLLIPFLPQHVYNRILTIFKAVQDVKQDSSAQTRVNIIKTVLPMFKTYIFSGVGLGTDIFRQVVKNYHQYTRVIPPHTHVLYLQIWVEAGIAGFITFIWYIYRTIKNSVIGIYNSTGSMKYIIAAGTASLAGILTTSLVEYSWYYPRVMFIFWTVLGLLTAAVALTEAKNRKLSENQ
jgi:hypothetical protein